MRRSYVQIDGVLYEKGTEPVEYRHYVMGDIDFVANDGTHIKSRSQWRDHLKRTNAVEMGHSDIKHAEASHQKRKDAFQARLRRADGVQPVNVPYREWDAYKRSQIASEVLGRLHGRQVPDRKTVIKIALEEARRRR